MPFLLYEKSDDILQQINNVSLNTKRGPFAQHVRKLVEDGADPPIKWQLTASDMLGYLGVDSPDQHRLIVDLKPSVENNVSLYKITDVWGHSKSGWTPLGLRMETLFVDRQEPNPDEFKQRFRVPPDAGDLVHEFLYLTAGTDSGPWRWGKTGRVNAALLWPETFRYFVESMTKDLEWAV